MKLLTVGKRLYPFVVTLFSCCLISPVFGQTSNNYSLVDNLQPVTPTAWQFQKYDQLPVSEYTGVPNISVPLYQISEDGVKIPIKLTYHGGGIRVNEEASWVGLGWDMTIGSIVQQINDIDDFTPNANHLQPDWPITGGPPSIYPFKYKFCGGIGIGLPPCINNCSGGQPINPVSLGEKAIIYTDMFAPFNGDDNASDYDNFFYISHFYQNIDSEPDVFSANFCGYSFKFIVQWNPMQIVVLDKKGYKINKSASGWSVVVPSGEEYDFMVKDSVTSVQQSTSITGMASPSVAQPSTITWMLTKIITKNKKVITFNYTQTAVEQVYPTFTQKAYVPVLGATGADPGSFCQTTDLTAVAIGNSTPATRIISYEPYTYLSSISFPNGTINFNLSARNDILGGLKLDSLQINSTQTIKSWKFNYSYFNAAHVGGNILSFNDTLHANNRLKLLSLIDNSGGKYTFTYNNTQLPAKSSYATDYWGYYNGDTTNTTLIPNGTQFKQTNYYTNTDNHSANLAYAQACTLTQLQYPTGGTVNFTYGLNQFSNYWVPDYSSNTNTISSGDGIRIQSIVWKDMAGTQLKQTNYTYNGGLATIGINFFREYPYTVTAVGSAQDSNNGVNARVYTVYETNMSGNFTSNPVSSFNGVGYTQVIKTDVDPLGNANGKTVTYYYNNPDVTYNAEYVLEQGDITMPAYKNPVDTAENGSVKSEWIYNNVNHLLKKTVNSYSKSVSPYFSAARLMGYGTYVSYTYVNGAVPPWEQNAFQQNIVGYYPIYDFETLLTQSAETNYFGADSLTVTKINTYDQYNQLSGTQQDNSDGTITYFGYGYPYSAYPQPGTVFYNMTQSNRLSDIVMASQQKSRPGNSPENVNSFFRSYEQLGNLFVAAKDSVYKNLSVTLPDRTTYDQYDASNGNVLQYSQNAVPTSLLWDYNKEYVIAMAKNANYNNIAYTSFEADGTGRWKFTGTPTPDPTAPTGQKVYSLAGGNIYRDSLNTALTYVVSYWSKNGAQTVSGSTATKTGYTFNGYTYYEHTVPTPASGTVTVSGTGTIDELRLYPNTAMMTSYTYNPLVGISSESNESGRIAYYEYDNAMRLLDIRDQNKHILKAFCYNYAGQPTTCGLDITYSSQALSQTFTKNNCSSGYIGSQATYNVPLGKYTSTMSLADANNQAQADLTANGQASTNANGSCALPPTITDVQYAGHGTGLTQVVFTTMPGCSTIVVNWKDITTGSNSSDAGGCTSPRTETITVGHDYQFTITEYSTTFGTVTSAPFSYHAYD